MAAVSPKALALLLLLPAVPATLTGWLHPNRPDWHAARHPVSQVDLRAVPGNALWLDAREADDYAAGHVPGAIHLSESDWETGLVALLDVWQPDAPLVVYCGGAGCDASRAVAERLRRELAIESVFVLTGGWAAWVEVNGQGAGR